MPGINMSVIFLRPQTKPSMDGEYKIWNIHAPTATISSAQVAKKNNASSDCVIFFRFLGGRGGQQWRWKIKYTNNRVTISHRGPVLGRNRGVSPWHGFEQNKTHTLFSWDRHDRQIIKGSIQFWVTVLCYFTDEDMQKKSLLILTIILELAMLQQKYHPKYGYYQEAIEMKIIR